MELVLNILWLLLALPALWIWRYGAPRADRAVRFARLGPLLILGCVLVLLFPVISATDDLHAMQFEMEEPGSQSRVKQSAGDRSCCPVFKSCSLPVQSVSSLCDQPHDKVCGRVYFAPLPIAGETSVYQLASRAPPSAPLG